MSEIKFNPYKAFSVISKLLPKALENGMGRSVMGDIKISMLGSSSKPNVKFAPANSSVMELGKILDENKIGYDGFEPYDFDLPFKIDIIKKIYNTQWGILFIGCPHDFIKEIDFHKDSMVIDPFGIVNKGMMEKVYTI